VAEHGFISKNPTNETSRGFTHKTGTAFPNGGSALLCI